MKLIALGMFVFCSFSYAQIEAEKSVSMELPVKTERGAKPYLLHQAVLETITQQASALNLDKELFDGQLREKFKIYFESYKTRKGTEKFGKNFAETMPQDEQKAFFDSLEKPPRFRNDSVGSINGWELYDSSEADIRRLPKNPGIGP